MTQAASGLVGTEACPLAGVAAGQCANLSALAENLPEHGCDIKESRGLVTLPETSGSCETLRWCLTGNVNQQNV